MDAAATGGSLPGVRGRKGSEDIRIRGQRLIALPSDLFLTFLPPPCTRAGITCTFSLMSEIFLLGVKAFYFTVNVKDISLGKCILCKVQLKIKIRYFSVLKWGRIDQLR